MYRLYESCGLGVTSLPRASTRAVVISSVSQVAEKDRAPEAAIVALAHQIAEQINAVPFEEREALREDAISIVRDETEMSRPAVAAVIAPETAGTFNPFGIGIPLILMGAVLVFLFPPVGLLLFGVAGVVIAWGVGATLLARR